MIKSNGGIIGPDNVTTGGAFGTASGVFKLSEVTNLIKESKWPTEGPPITVSNSARFNTASSDSLTRTQSASPTSATKGTLSFWIKRSLLDVSQYYMSTFQDSNNRVQSWFQADNTFKIIQKVSASTTIEIITNRVFRDISAWYHVVLAFDTDQGTSSNRVKIYINGVQETSFSTATYPAQGQDSFLTKGTSASLGAYNGSGDYTSAYFSEIVLIDGQQLTPTSFAETNSDTGIWVPKAITGLTFGTNGYYLKFTNSGALGEDFSGNDNDFTVNNLTSLDQSIDTPNNNFATINPLDVSLPSTFALSEGNLDAHLNGYSSNIYPRAFSNFQVTAGKWYVECKITEEDDSGMVGITSRSAVSGTDYMGLSAYDYRYYHDGTKMNNNSSSSYGTTWDGGDTIGIALDMDNLAVYFSLNGTFQASGDPTSGASRTNAAFNLTAVASTPDGAYKVGIGTQGDGNGTRGQWNFGSPPYAISSGNADGNGFGNFEYAVPSGYLSLCTNNLNSI